MNKSPEFDMLKEPAEPERKEGAVESQRDRKQASKGTMQRLACSQVSLLGQSNGAEEKPENTRGQKSCGCNQT